MLNALTSRHYRTLRKMFDAKDAKGAAQYIADQVGIQQRNAMDAAHKIGYRVEFYVNSIRVEIPNRRRSA